MPGGGPNTPPDGPNKNSAPVDTAEVGETSKQPEAEKPVDGEDAKEGE